MAVPFDSNANPARVVRRAMAALAFLAVPAMAVAQGTAPSPGQGAGDVVGLFAGGAQTQSKGQSLGLNLSIAQAFDQLADGTTSNVPPLGQAGYYTTGSADLRYGLRRRRLQIGAAAGSTGWYYPSVSGGSSASYYGSGGFAVQLRRRTEIFVNQSVSYDPWFLARLFPVEVATTPGENALPPAGLAPDRRSAFTTYSTAASLSHGITRRGTISVNGSFRKGVLDSQNSQTISYIGGRFSYGLTRNASLRLGYGYRSGDFGYKTGPIVSHDIDVGIDYNRPLSLSRRTIVTFSVGSTLMRRPLVDPNGLGDLFLDAPDSTIGTSQSLQYAVTGNASLSHRIARTWTAQADYDRGVLFYEGIAQPVLSDAIRASLEGQLSRRMSFSASAGYTKGVSATIGQISDFNAYLGNARIQYLFRKPWVVYGEYAYDGYDISRALQLVNGVPANTRRNTVRAGLSVWVPLAGR